MMNFYPNEKENRLVNISKARLSDNLEKYIQPIKSNIPKEEAKDFLFNGIWSEDGFSVSLKLKISNNFVPIINGSFVTSDNEVLLQLTYDLFPATKRLLLFWTVLTLLITLFFVVLYQAWLYGAISFGFCIVNYVMSRENFKIQVRKSKRMLEKMLS